MDLARKYHISEKTVKLLQKGLDYCNLGRYSVGLSYMEKALKRDPNSAFVLNHVGMTYMSMGRFEDALNSFKRAVEIDPANLDYLYNLARAYSKSKRYETAYKTYLKYIEQASYHIRDINEIGIDILGMCEKMGNFTYAVEYWLKAVKIDPEIDKFWMNLSAAFLFNRDYNEAIASIVYYNYAFGPKTRDYEGFLNLVNIYIELKDFVKAQKLLKYLKKRYSSILQSKRYRNFYDLVKEEMSSQFTSMEETFTLAEEVELVINSMQLIIEWGIENFRLYKLLCSAYIISGKYNIALKLLDKMEEFIRTELIRAFHTDDPYYRSKQLLTNEFEEKKSQISEYSVRLAICYLLLNDFENLNKFLESYKGKKIYSKFRNVLKGIMLYKQGLPDEALEYFQQVEKLPFRLNEEYIKEKVILLLERAYWGLSIEKSELVCLN